LTALLDTSALLVPRALERLPGEASISVITLGELHFGVAAARAREQRAARTVLLGTIEALFDPLPITPAIARVWGQLCGAAVERGLQPRRRTADLLIAATARVHDARLYTTDRDLEPFADLVDVEVIAAPG
jgi:predicted nucleic acid-binding protein